MPRRLGGGSRFAVDSKTIFGLHLAPVNEEKSWRRWPQMGPFIRREVSAMLDAATTVPVSAPLVLQEEAVPYCTGSQWEWAERLAA